MRVQGDDFDMDRELAYEEEIEEAAANDTAADEMDEEEPKDDPYEDQENADPNVRRSAVFPDEEDDDKEDGMRGHGHPDDVMDDEAILEDEEDEEEDEEELGEELGEEELGEEEEQGEEELDDEEEEPHAADAVANGVPVAEVVTVQSIRAAHSDENGRLTRDGAVKIIELLAHGRIKVDAFDHFWTCDLDDSRWSTTTSDMRWQRMLRRMRNELGVWCEKGAALKAYFAPEPDYYDPQLHEKMDKTLQSGMLCFRNGKLLDLSDASSYGVRDLQPTDYVSITGAIDRDLPPEADFDAKWMSDQLRDELVEKIRKNFSDDTSALQVHTPPLPPSPQGAVHAAI